MLEKFVVGSRWFRRDYEFEVVANNGQTAEYVKVDPDGTLNKFVGGIIDNAETQMRIHENVMYAKDRALRESMGLTTKKSKVKTIQDTTHINKHFYTLGFLAKHGFLSLRTTEETENKEGGWYREITGKYPWDEELGYEHDVCTDTWATRLAISFPEELMNAKLIFPNPLTPTENRLFLYNTDWCRELVQKGFRLGRKHDVEQIRSKTPQEYLKYFEKGFNV
jgi:hypothetical protein